MSTSPATSLLYLADGFSEDQQVFLAVGQAWCGRVRPAEAERRFTVDSHVPAKFRVYGALRNLKEFADAFRCAAGTPMRCGRPGPAPCGDRVLDDGDERR